MTTAIKFYSIVDPMTFISLEEYNKKVDELKADPNLFAPIYFKVNTGKYTNWFFKIENATIVEKGVDEASIQCQYTILRIPKKIEDEEAYRQKPFLDKLISDVFYDLINTSVPMD